MSNEREGRLHAAHALYQAGCYFHAEISARSLTLPQPGDLRARAVLAASLYRRGLVELALDQIEVAIEHWPGDEDLALLRQVFAEAR